MAYTERLAAAICQARVDEDGIGHPPDGKCLAMATAATASLRADLIELEMRRWFGRG